MTSVTAPTISAIAAQEGVDRTDVSRIIALAYLAPDIIEAIIAGRQPPTLTATRPKRFAPPNAWYEQRRILGFEG